MIIDATKINYFSDPQRSSYDEKPKRKSHKRDKEDLGVIVDVSSTRKSKRTRKSH